MQNIRIYIDKLILISCILVSVCIIAFHLSYGFEDIGVRLQEILNKAKKSALEPILESSKLSSLQKSMFVKSGFTMSKEQLELGKILYFDPRLSGDKRHSCNTCHNLALAGTSYIDNSSANPQKLNAPTLYNAIFNDVAYYRGAISRLDKADKNTTNFLSKNVLARASLHALSASNEMNANVDKMIAMIANSDEYMAYFKRAFGSKVKVNADLISQSLAGFIMSLNTFSRYDDFLMGNLRALSLEEAQGLELFIDKGCVACHNGINLGGTMQPFEVMRKYQFSNIGGLQSDADKMLKVSSLRNITLSAPYFHNGGFEKLEDAIKEMGQMQLGIDLSNKEIKQLILFLETLRGNLDSINLPNLPRM
ncbi:cytochrome C peroxidase [Helicobacter didelphidarum]|uniref:Cytochrome C peroxidase n=2 Tax=Helicobacter didelphidarum TaxID=2040648 RepID=A0A3D8IKP7_9HELI|nr:cytochrome C peroxidase [Helicobacter didelphidarum]